MDKNYNKQTVTEETVNGKKSKSISPRTKLLDACPVCQSKNTKFFFTSIDKLHGVPGQFDYQRCVSCETIFQNPMVIQEDLGLCYSSDYTPYNYYPEIPELNVEFIENQSSFSISRNLIRQAIIKKVWGEQSLSGFAGFVGNILARSRILRERAFLGLVDDELLPRNREGDFALDVGCGAGRMLKKLRRVGWQVEGIEWDEKAAEIARQRTGEKIWTGDFREIKLEDGKYRLILLSHVFEHLINPVEALERFYRLLADKGKIVLIYPNANSYSSNWFKEDWFAWEAPRHLVFPTPKGLSKVIHKIGFAKMKVYTKLDEYNWKTSKANKLGRHAEKEAAKLNLAEKAGILIEDFLVKTGVNKGSEIVIILEKS